MNGFRSAKLIEPFRPYWFEEPCPPDNNPAIKEVKSGTNIPTVDLSELSALT